MAFVALTFSCKQQGNSASDTKLIVKFDESVKVSRADSSVVNTGDAVSEGEELILSPANLESGKFVSSWMINGVACSDSAQGKYIYNVKKSDAKTEGSISVLNISFSTTTSTKLVIKFTNDILCNDVISSLKVLSGTEVTEGKKLEFTASLFDEEACENWYVNGVKIPVSLPRFQYVVAKVDAKIENNVPTINISFKKTTPKKLTIKFDDNNIWATNENNKRIFNDDEVNTSNIITFKANIEAGKAVNFWFVGDAKQEDQTSRTFVYTPVEKDAVSDGDKKVITIRCEKRNSQKIRIDFNPDDIYTSTGIESGSMVDDGTFILFNSKFTSNSYSPTWYVNDKKQPAQSLGGDAHYDKFIQTFKYTVDIKDAIDEGGVKVIKVSYKVPDKNKKITITFPQPQVVIIVPGVGVIQSGTQVNSGDDLGVQANYGYEGDNYGQTVALDSWFVNGKKIGYPKIVLNPTIFSTGGSAFAYMYRVDEEDADENGTINISYTTHERKEISIEFDDTIAVYKGPIGAQSPIDSGELIKEDTFLKFEKETAQGEYFDNHFYFNGKKWETILSADLYLLNANDAVEKDGILVLQVTTKKPRPEEKIKVIWDDSNMTCEHSGTALVSGGRVTENTELIFKYNLTDETKIIRGFFTDGKDDSHTLARDGDTDKVEGCALKASLEYCKKEGNEYVLRPRFQLDNKEKVTVEFDSSITCTNKDDNSNVMSGMEIPEGTSLSFQATLQGQGVRTWIVGIKEIHGGRLTLQNPAVWCVRKDWAKKENGKYVARVSFQE